MGGGLLGVYAEVLLRALLGCLNWPTVVKRNSTQADANLESSNLAKVHDVIASDQRRIAFRISPIDAPSEAQSAYQAG
jgi:hypothetical protein